MAQPVPGFRSSNAFSGTASATINITGANPRLGDFALVMCETMSGDTTVAAPTGYTELSISPQDNGLGASGTRLSVFYKFVTSLPETNVSIGGSLDHIFGSLLLFPGVDPNNPITASAGGVKASASTTTTFDTISSSYENSLFVFLATNNLDSATANWSAFNNGNLNSAVERLDSGTNLGNGGCCFCETATRSTPGSSGSISATVTSSTDAHISLVLKPEETVGLKTYKNYRGRRQPLTRRNARLSLLYKTPLKNDTFQPFLSLDTESYLVSGVDAALTYGRALSLDTGSYTVTGANATMLHGYNLVASAASYLVSGADAALTHSYMLSLGSGAYTYTGADATLSHGYNLNAALGTYTYTGSLANLARGLQLTASTDTYTVSGANATLLREVTINAAASSYSVTGIAAFLTVQRMLNAAAGSYSVTGNDASFYRTYFLNASSGAYTTVGADAFLTIQRMLNLSPGSYAVIGNDATLIYVPAGSTYTLSADPGSYTITGADATLIYIPSASGGETDTGKFYGMGITRKFRFDPKPLFTNNKQ